MTAGRYAALKLENRRLLRKDLARRETVYRGLPEVVTLNHTDLCNLRCVMCPRSKGQGKHRLDRAVLEHVAQSLFPTATKVVLTTSGGEPLAADFDLLMERALAFEARIDVVTNGLLLTRPLYRRARGALDHLNVSVDCHVPAVYERIRAGSRWSTLESNLAAVRDERHEHPDDVLYTMSAVVLRDNLPHLPDFVRFAAGMGAEAVILQRLQQSILRLSEHDAERDPGPAVIAQTLDAARAAARESGINLYLGSLGQAAEQVRPVRAKLPPEIEDRGVCWFMAQQFAVMYTGEVYPCCVPTDHCLGNVLYEDPVRIWNGAPAQQLREAHVSGRGTAFCSGCEHAPYLPARPAPVMQEGWRRARRGATHVLRGAQRRFDARRRPPIYAPPLPEIVIRDGAFGDGTLDRACHEAPHANELLARRRDGPGVYFARRGTLFAAASPVAPARTVAGGLGPPDARATCLEALPDGALLLAFQAQGRLLRVEPAVDDGFPPRVETVIEFSDPRSFVRQSNVALDEHGRIWIGEYGLFPGARCANLYLSRNGGRSFGCVARIEDAKHIHVVHARPGRDEVLVTTGDLPGEQRLYALRGARLDCLRASWSGFTAIAETAGWLHFGTDLPERNGLLRLRADLTGPVEFRAFPEPLDLQVRQLVVLDDGRLVATTCMDESLPERRSGRRAALLSSPDEGQTWGIAYRFASDWSDVAEGVFPFDGGRLATICTEHPRVIDV